MTYAAGGAFQTGKWKILECDRTVTWGQDRDRTNGAAAPMFRAARSIYPSSDSRNAYSLFGYQSWCNADGFGGFGMPSDPRERCISSYSGGQRTTGLLIHH